MLLREARVTVTDLDILLHLHNHPRSVDDLRKFLACFNNSNVSTYIGRLKGKNLVEKLNGKYALSENGKQIIARIKEATQ